MDQKVKEYIVQNQMIDRGDRVVAGISGGADSVCMFYVLQHLKEELDMDLIAVHVHHGIRGESADRDLEFVRTLCEKFQVKFRPFREDIPAYARLNGFSEEEAGRIRRRQIFEQVAEEEGAAKIALAHHEDDNAETVLMNLCRGSGMRGLCGIAPAEGKYIRPLLCMNRKEIETYLKDHGIAYCEDETNLSDAYTRNRVRNQILPLLNEKVNAGASGHISETATRMRGIFEYIEEEAKHYQKISTRRQGDQVLILAKEYVKVPKALKGEMLMRVLSEAAGKRKDLTEIHVNLLKELMEKQTGRKQNLPYDIVAERTYEGILIGKKEQMISGLPSVDEDGRKHFHFRVFPKTPDIGPFPKTTYTKWFDYDIIKDALEIRHRKSGDFLQINCEGQTQKLKQYFINEKIPSRERDRIWLVAKEEEIIWVVGYRQNPGYQITERTENILEICYMEEE